jgi:hypothetical protein
MSHAILQVIAFAAVVLSFAVFYFTGLVLETLKKNPSFRAGRVILLLLSMGWIGTLIFLADTL